MDVSDVHVTIHATIKYPNREKFEKVDSVLPVCLLHPFCLRDMFSFIRNKSTCRLG